MGYKYSIYGFDYPYIFHGYETCMQCRTAITCILWVIIFWIKFDSVDVNIRRGDGRKQKHGQQN
jgi:hypothetical protein